jgi:hypothetical protein
MNAIFIVTILILFILAIYWEYKDIKAVENLKSVHSIEDKKERSKIRKFVGTFMYKNNIMWRSIFIATSIAMAIIVLYLNHIDCKLDIFSLSLIFFIIFIAFYFTNVHRTTHLYRVLAGKIDKNLLMEDLKKTKNK